MECGLRTDLGHASHHRRNSGRRRGGKPMAIIDHAARSDEWTDQIIVRRSAVPGATRTASRCRVTDGMIGTARITGASEVGSGGLSKNVRLNPMSW